MRDKLLGSPFHNCSIDIYISQFTGTALFYLSPNKHVLIWSLKVYHQFTSRLPCVLQVMQEVSESDVLARYIVFFVITSFAIIILLFPALCYLVWRLFSNSPNPSSVRTALLRGIVRVLVKETWTACLVFTWTLSPPCTLGAELTWLSLHTPGNR